MKKSPYILAAIIFLSIILCFQLAGCNRSETRNGAMEDSEDREEPEAEETGNGTAEDEQEEAEETEDESPAAREEVLSESPNTEKFDEYFSDIGLGKLAADADLLQDMEPDVIIFLPDEGICLYGTLKKSAIIGVAIYNPETSSYESERQDLPQTLEKGGFTSCSPISFGSGKYEYRVYIGDTLVSVLTFEVK
ncbi:MAG: hypothetical protein U9O59_04165 [Actinomycetota bacterium]|nr:hypothetical protein [Actinomycetota bacterium]